MIESLILAGLVKDEEYMRKVIPFVDIDYFDDPAQRTLFASIYSYVEKYNGLPTKEALLLETEDNPNLNEEKFKSVVGMIDLIYETDLQNDEWMITKTEKFCQDKAVYNAVRDSIKILEGEDKKRDRGYIPTLLSDALSVTFDSNIGHDFIGNSVNRFDFYNRKEEKIPFDLDYFNRITKNGLSRKSLSIILGGTGGGKTLAMCHMAAANFMAGYNVLYITLEMAEERIAERIDANLFNVRVDDVPLMEYESYAKRVNRIKSKTNGKLIIKEYPTASANANHFRFLLQELKLKKNFVPDIIYVDYINICASSRLKMGNSVNSYTYIKSIAEELRGLAIEFNVAMVSATQLNRSGFKNSDPGLEDTSESFGLPATADFMVAIVSSEELEELNQLMVKQLKNRWGDISNPKRFVIGVDRSKMKLYNLEESAQEDIINPEGKKRKQEDDVPLMDKTAFGKGLSTERKDWS